MCILQSIQKGLDPACLNILAHFFYRKIFFLYVQNGFPYNFHNYIFFGSMPSFDQPTSPIPLSVYAKSKFSLGAFFYFWAQMCILQSIQKGLDPACLNILAHF